MVVQGLCTVDLEFKPGRSSAIATSLDVSQAAIAVLAVCVAEPGANTGGLAIDISEYMTEQRSITAEVKLLRARSHSSPQAKTTI